MEYADLLIENHGKVAVVRLNRPKAMNALNDNMMNELGHALRAFDQDPAINVIVLTGSEKAFAAGADIAAMAQYDYQETYGKNYIGRNWEHILDIRKPVIGVVSGYCLGGGCELAMMCDFLIAADSAKFGQPEIKLAVSPGMGGSQRLTHAVGKAKAMEMVLTGRMMDAVEAERAGLVSRIVPADDLVEEAVKTAATIAAMAPLAVLANKEMVNAAFETGLAMGVQFERRLFHGLFGTADQSEGMAAFVEKRAGTWTGK